MEIRTMHIVTHWGLVNELAISYYHKYEWITIRCDWCRHLEDIRQAPYWSGNRSSYLRSLFLTREMWFKH